jgi:RNA recognition motif-containing protein
MESKLFVGNLSYDVTEDQLRELFSQAGAVKDVMVIMDRGTGRSKGFGFVEMLTQVEAEKAIKLFNDHELDGRRLVVNIARPREERPRSGGFGDRGGGGRDRRGGGGRDRRGGGGRDRRY